MCSSDLNATANCGITVHHVLLMNRKKDIDKVAAAVRKLVDNIAEVRKITPGAIKKYQALSR